jgi:succinylarginine dihydrolase
MPKTSEKKFTEINFDGLVGPTHNYSGLSHGNIASMNHRTQPSNPLSAVLQGLEKMKRLADLGLKQAVLPPQERPHISSLRQLGFTGSDKSILEKVAREAPDLLSAVSSASSMWTANAATVSPSSDTLDGKVHFTPANLVAKFHRSIEAVQTSLVLQKIFNNPSYFTHHAPLPSVPAFGDEGAANHTRLCAPGYGTRGIEFFVYGRGGLRSLTEEPRKFQARQTIEASTTIARTHQLAPAATVFAQQHPAAIDAGVFHNDVVGVGNQDIYFFHELSFFNSKAVLQELREKFLKVCHQELRLIEVPSAKVSIEDAVQSYLFNSQLITLPDGAPALILPEESKTTPSVARYIEELLAQNSSPIQKVFYFDLRQSMSNGGGPACLRLRVVLSKEESAATHQPVFLDDQLYARLTAWAKKHYRDRLLPKDLADPELLKESRNALDELTTILELGSLYSFQA